ncbi:lipoate--protein ligase family protein [bacterium]|nr:lipoate--protein ligase family protein [bacterium]MBU1959531.1 lipoate--protein ligase family protein [bacterium]
MYDNQLQTWYLMDGVVNSASWNMAVDEALLYSFKDHDIPILRIYGWENALSFGRFSKPDKIIDINRIKYNNISYVRRITGGGVLVHGNDISYTIIMPRKLLEGRSIKENYYYLSGFLIKFYEKLALKAEFASTLNFNISSSDICLAANEPYDIMINANKMGGNAQRYIKHTLLQHGTIPIRFDKKYFELLFFKDSGLSHATSLQELGIHIEYKNLVDLLIEAFYETYNVHLISKGLEWSQEQYAQELLKNKYTKEKWNLYGK